MKLSALIYKNKTEKVATLTVATITTQTKQTSPTVAKVATVTVANLQESRNVTIPPEKTKIQTLTEPERKKIMAWLSHIGETDQGMIDETLSRCADNPETLAYFLMRAEEVPKQAVNPAVITCRYCEHFKSFNAHGGGAGTCNAGVMQSGACFWADTLHPCDQYQLNQ